MSQGSKSSHISTGSQRQDSFPRKGNSTLVEFTSRQMQAGEFAEWEAASNNKKKNCLSKKRWWVQCRHDRAFNALMLLDGVATRRIANNHRSLGIIGPLPHTAIVVLRIHMYRSSIERRHTRRGFCLLGVRAARSNRKALPQHKVQETGPDSTCSKKSRSDADRWHIQVKFTVRACSEVQCYCDEAAGGVVHIADYQYSTSQPPRPFAFRNRRLRDLLQSTSAR